jgi:hypothetical protein
MANYTKLTDFASKDTLPSGNAAKIVKGTEIDDELAAIETAITSKANSDSPALTGTPTAPTAVSTTNTTQIATCAFVQTVATEIASSAVAAGIDNADADIVINSIAMGDWTIEDNGSTVLNIAYNGTNIFKLDSSGNLTVTGNITAYGTV